MRPSFQLSNLLGVGGLGVGFGTNRLGSLTRKERESLLSRVWDLGIRHFDTAPLYGSGDAESWLGEFLATGRLGATIMTKCGLQPPLRGRAYALRAVARHVRRWIGPLATIPGKQRERNAAPRVFARSASEYRAIASDMEAALDASLVKLRRDYVDVFAIHEPDRGIYEVEEIFMQLRKLKDAGKVRALAAAGYFEEVFAIASSGAQPLDVYQFDHDPEGTHIARWLDAKLPPPILFGALSKSIAPDEHRVHSSQISPSSQLKAALDANPEGLVLFSTTKIAHAKEVLIPIVQK